MLLSPVLISRNAGVAFTWRSAAPTFGSALAQADGEVATAALNELERVIGLTEVRFDAGEVAGTELRRLQVERLRFVDGRLGRRAGRSQHAGHLARDVRMPPT